MIEIKITDPANTPKAELTQVIALLSFYADLHPVISDNGLKLTATDVRIRTSAHNHTLSETAARILATELPVERIAADDHPDKGVDTAEIFAGGVNPADVGFGQGQRVMNAAVNLATGKASTVNEALQQAGNVPVAGQVIASSNDVVSATVQRIDSAPALDVDKNGLPWDERIHAGSRLKNQDGTWKARKNTDPAVKAQVENELRGVVGNVPVVGSPVAVVPPPPPIVAQPLSPVVPETVVVPPPPPPAPNITPVAEAPPVVVVPNARVETITFADLCKRITAVLNVTLTHDQLAAVLAAHGLEGLPALATNERVLPLVARDLGFI